MIINNIFQSGEWPHHWKLEYVVPIGKTPVPESEDDLRPISLTPFFSKVTERFVVVWLMSYLEDKLDFRQYGGLKGNSITHYIIEFINFILSCQDSNDQTAILACVQSPESQPSDNQAQRYGCSCLVIEDSHCLSL